ncbi:transmembrane protein 80-like [Xyrauchen texanus]|uniref:transmembrane protein 80-like n=1 Tax=Xyrauchen texanus TaxID=154827 RepID=UPI002241DDFE|nr:transmembrane protein 80-like [Xyrauchen texanus]XP_051975831.1 transmembrane protein 80-like [Xyrauchen texanus]
MLLQILLYLSGAYSVFYFLSTLSMIIYKSRVLSYPDGQLTLDVFLLFLMAGFEALRVYWGVRGNLQESEIYTGSNLIATGATVLLALYFIIWQSYVLRADVIIGAILVCLYGLTGIVGLGALARFTS